jgi:hypothetical protein
MTLTAREVFPEYYRLPVDCLASKRYDTPEAPTMFTYRTDYSPRASFGIIVPTLAFLLALAMAAGFFYVLLFAPAPPCSDPDCGCHYHTTR